MAFLTRIRTASARDARRRCWNTGGALVTMTSGGSAWGGGRVEDFAASGHRNLVRGRGGKPRTSRPSRLRRMPKARGETNAGDDGRVDAPGSSRRSDAIKSLDEQLIELAKERRLTRAMAEEARVRAASGHDDPFAGLEVIEEGEEQEGAEEKAAGVSKAFEKKMAFYRQVAAATRCRIGTIKLPPALEEAITGALDSISTPKLRVDAAALSERLRAAQGSLRREDQIALRKALLEEEKKATAADDGSGSGTSTARTGETAAGAAASSLDGAGGEGGAALAGAKIRAGSGVKELSKHPVYLSALAADIAREGRGGDAVQYATNDAYAYLASRMPSTWAVVRRVLGEVSTRRPDWQPSTMLDFGSGPATAALAAWDVWGEAALEGGVSNVEFSTAMRQAGEDVLRRMDAGGANDEKAVGVDGYHRRLKNKYEEGWAKVRRADESGVQDDVSGRVKWTRALPSMSLFVKPSEMVLVGAPEERAQTYDLVTSAYALNELRTFEDRLEMASLLFERVAPEGMLVLIEPGTPFGFSNIKAVRQMLLDAHSRDECHVFAPCPHDGACPKVASSWCHFVQRVQRPERQRRVKLGSTMGHEDEKFSYVVIQKGPRPPSTFIPPGIPDPPPPAAELAANGADWARIVAEPKKRGKHVIVRVCGRNGAVEERTIGKSKDKDGVGYRIARKSGWGDLYPYEYETRRERGKGVKGKRRIKKGEKGKEIEDIEEGSR